MSNPPRSPLLNSTGKRSQCCGCGEVFSTVSNFDKHRRGGVCAAPSDIGMVPHNVNGHTLWRAAPPNNNVEVTKV